MINHNLLVLTDEDSDNDDEIMANIAMQGRAAKIIRPRPNYFVMLNNEEFFVRFRLTKPTVLDLFARVEEEISSPTDQNNAVAPMNRLLLALRFYASGSMLIAAGDFAGVHKSTACAIVHKVSFAIANLSPNMIRFPVTPEEIEEVKRGFYERARFPNVVGAIDCTHVKIQSVGGDQAETFRNRKGYFSVNVQTICAANLRILDIVARRPGSSHDRTIFNNSSIKARFESGEMGSGLLLGDSGYTLSPYVIIPLRNPVTQEEQLFNEAQIRTRNVVERQYGVWKRRFPILSLGMRIRLDHALTIIVATAVLHNLACDANEEDPIEEPGIEAHLDNDMPVDVVPENLHGDGAVRQALINDYFRALL